jgi:parvulin-like peptidyl-prolyl isomerase
MSPTTASPPRAVRIAGLFLIVSLAGCVLESPRTKIEREMEAVKTSPWEDPGAVVIEVNGRRITRGDFYHRVLEKFGAHMLVSGLIKEELFLQEAERLGIRVSDREVEDMVQRRLDLEAREVGGMENLKEVYARQDLTLEQVRADYAAKVREEALILAVVKARRRIDEKGLRDYYQETFARTRYRLSQVAFRFRDRELVEPESVVSRRKLDADERARRVAQRARAGADFAELARFESEDMATRDRGGDLGVYVTVETPMPASIKEAVFKLAPGEVSDPVEHPDLGSIHVFKMVEVLPARGFNECRAALQEELSARLPSAEEVGGVLEELRKRAEIQVFGFPVGGSGPRGREAAMTAKE